MNAKKNQESQYPDFQTWVWKSCDEKQIVSIDDFLKKNSESSFYVGTDSRQTYDSCIFVTAITAYKPGRGGSVIIHRNRTARYKTLRPRMIMEGFRTLETAWYIDKYTQANHFDKVKMCLHVDVNESLDFESGAYREELAGLIISQGYEVKWKPDSWAATTVADKFT